MPEGEEAGVVAGGPVAAAHQNLGKVSLRRFMRGLATLYALCIAAAMAVIVVAGIARSDAADREATALEALTAVESLGETFSNMETGQRGFVISGDDSFLEPFSEARPLVDVELDRLRLLVSENEGSVALVEELETAANRWIEEHAEPEIQATRDQGREVGIAMIVGGDGKASFDRIRSRLAAVRSIVQAEVDASVSDSNRADLVELLALLSTIAVTGIVGALGFRTVRNSITVPLEVLTAAVNDTGYETATARPGHELREVADVASAVERLHDGLRNQQRAEQEARAAMEQQAFLVLAANRQLSHFDESFPDGWAAAGILKPASGLVAGDTFDILLLSPTTIGVILVDVCGHGAHVTLEALRCRELLRASLRQGLAPHDAVGGLNQMGVDEEVVFVTTIVAVIDTESGSMAYASGGHPPLLVCDGGEPVDCLATGPFVGPIPEATWDTVQVDLPPKAAVVIYSDGVTDARNTASEFYGEERLAARLRGPLGAPDEMAKLVMDDVKEFAGGEVFGDDATILVVRRYGAGSEK